MAQITNGIRAMLSHPSIYNSLQSIMGAQRARQEFVREFVRPANGLRVLDIGCGTAELLGYLPDDVTYVGYDPSESYIAHARLRFGDRGEFHCGFFDLNEARHHLPFDVVIASGVLHHMDNIQAKEMMTLASNSLRHGGRLVTIDPVLCSGQNVVARFLIRMDRGQNVRDENGYKALAKTSFTEINGTVRHRSWIPYTHFIMECWK